MQPIKQNINYPRMDDSGLARTFVTLKLCNFYSFVFREKRLYASLRSILLTQR